MVLSAVQQPCTMKGVVAVDAAWQAVGMAMQDVFIYNVPHRPPRHGGTEKTLVDILRDKKME